MDIYRKAFYQEISQLHQPIINWAVLFIWVQWLTYSWNLGADYQNWQRARIQKARYQQKIANQRKDYLHKLTTALVKQYDVIVIEDLKTKNLQHNHHLAKAITNASWYEFRTMLAYKCAWYGKKLIVVKPNYTSQICSHCGHHSGPKPLAVREWTCPKCGIHHDRDINAAVKILHKGLKAIG